MYIYTLVLKFDNNGLILPYHAHFELLTTKLFLTRHNYWVTRLLLRLTIMLIAPSCIKTLILFYNPTSLSESIKQRRQLMYQKVCGNFETLKLPEMREQRTSKVKPSEPPLRGPHQQNSVELCSLLFDFQPNKLTQI